MNFLQRIGAAVSAKAQYTAARYFGATVTEGISKGPKPRPFRLDQSVKLFSDWVYAATLLNAHAVASVPLRMYVRKRAGQKGLFKSAPVRSNARRKYLAGDALHRPSRTVMAKLAQFDQDYEEITEPHPALTLLSTANAWANGYELSVIRMLYLQICGNSYLHPVIDRRLGIPAELWILPAQWMKVVPSRTEFISGYKYGRQPNEVDFTPDEVGHWKLPSLDDVYYGKGKVEAAWSILGLHQAKRVQDQAKFDNFSRPDWIIGLEGAVLSSLERVEAKIEEKYQGPANAGKVLATNGKVTAQALNLPDPEVGDGDKVITELAAVIGVPLSKLLGNDPVKANSETMDAAWKADVILPYCRQDEEMLNQWYLPLFGIEDDAVLCYDNPVPNDRKFEMEERKAALAGASWKTPNEVREADGLDPVEGGDALFVPTTLVPVGMAGMMGMGAYSMFGQGGQPQAGAGAAGDAGGAGAAAQPAGASEATTGGGGPASVGATADVQSTVLNGAQMTAMAGIVAQVAAGEVPRDAGVQMLAAGLQISSEQADRIMGSAGTSAPTTPNPNPRADAQAQAQADAAQQQAGDSDGKDPGVAKGIAGGGGGPGSLPVAQSHSERDRDGSRSPDASTAERARNKVAEHPWPDIDARLKTMDLSIARAHHRIQGVEVVANEGMRANATGATNDNRQVGGTDADDGKSDQPSSGKSIGGNAKSRTDGPTPAEDREGGAGDAARHQATGSGGTVRDGNRHAERVAGKSFAPPLRDCPELAKVLRDIFARQKTDVMAQCRTKAIATKDDDRREGKPKPPPTIDLSTYDAQLAKAAEPVLMRMAKQAARSLVIPNVKLPASVLTVVDAKLPEAVADLSLKFAESTNATTSLKLNDALAQLRTDIEAGIVEGDTLPKMTERVQSTFATSDQRASDIARTEASRARHRAQSMTAKESGVVVGKRLMVSADACPICDAAAAKGTVSIAAKLTDGTYGDEDITPLHPNCACSLEWVTDENA